MLRLRNPKVGFTLSTLCAGLAMSACSSSESSTFDGGGGNGNDSGSPSDDGGPSFHFDAASDAGGSTTGDLLVTIRDFKLYDASDPKTVADFENVPKTDQNGNPNPNYFGPWDDHVIVADLLGADGKPAYKTPSGVTLTTHGAAAFDTWYHDVAGTNVHVDYPLHLTPGAGGSSSYDSEKTGVALSAQDPTKMFFPIDDGTAYATPFGNQGDPHNYSFTVELHTTFAYKGGEYFQFRGDDDVFVYVDKKLVINLGGIHGPETAQVLIDSLGLAKGSSYTLDFFSAERHKTGSNILFTTTLDLKPAPR
jgi:fibro-slime domain-containing protein